MLDLVAEASGCQVGILHLKEITVSILGSDAHHLRAGNHAVFPRYAQAALQSRLLSVSENDLGVHQLNDLVVLIQHHAHAAQDTHLGCGQSYASGIQQRVRHVVQKCV